MHKVRVKMVLSMPLAFCLCANLAAQTGRIESMKLLTPEVGWASDKGKAVLDDQWRCVGGRTSHRN